MLLRVLPSLPLLNCRTCRTCRTCSMKGKTGSDVHAAVRAVRPSFSYFLLNSYSIRLASVFCCSRRSICFDLLCARFWAPLSFVLRKEPLSSWSVCNAWGCMYLC